MILPPWAQPPLRLLSDADWLVAYRAATGDVAVRRTGSGRQIPLSGDERAALRDALPPQSRLVACRSMAILHDRDGVRVSDLPADAPLPPGEPDVGMPDLLCAPARALALPPGAWPLDPARLSAHARVALISALGAIPDGLEDVWIVRGRAGVAMGRADPRFFPEAVASA